MYLKCREFFIGVENRVFQHNRPGAVIRIAENYARRVAAYCAEPALHLWLWRVARSGTYLQLLLHSWN